MDEKPIKFYVVLVRWNPGVGRIKFFDAYPTRKAARIAMSEGRKLYGWAKVVKCEVMA